jgi:hypothetical protein
VVDRQEIRIEAPFVTNGGAKRERHCYAVSANSSRPISMRRISLVPAPIS